MSIPDLNFEAGEFGNNLQPVQVVVVYTDGKDHSASYYIESHQVESKNKKMVVGPGIPFADSTLSAMLERFGKSKKEDDYKAFNLTDNRLLWFKVSKSLTSVDLIWFTAPMKRKIFIKGMASGYMRVPGFVYCYRGGEFSIYTYKGNGKPEITRALCKVPFPNTYPDGHVCWGNTKLPPNRSGSISEEMNRWENRYWNSDFAGENIEGDKVSLFKLFKSLQKSGKPFPEEILKPSGKLTLKKLIEI